jgi:tRNA pseudouridine13 synthase
MVPKTDQNIGIDVYCTSFRGCGGKIKTNPSDFQVSEVISEKLQSQIKEMGDYAVYQLKKQNIDTNHALDKVFKKTGMRLKALGLKDSYALTKQYVCSMNKSKSIQNFESDKISLERIGYMKKPFTKKDMIGNQFKIKISEHNDLLCDFNEYDHILNFYGYQRFGSQRAVTHLIGRAIIQRNFLLAINYILTFTSKYDSKENTELRLKLQDNTKYPQMLPKIPPQMDLERIIVKEMIKHNDPLTALRALPVQIRRLYVQAYQSFLFNKTLSMAFNYGEELFSAKDGDVCYDKHSILGKFAAGLGPQHLAIPVIGYSYFKKTRFHYYISKILKEEIIEYDCDVYNVEGIIEEISPKDFFIKEMQEVSNEGGFRNSTIICNDFSVSGDTVNFTLSRGSFATILLREIIKPPDPILAGF